MRGRTWYWVKSLLSKVLTPIKLVLLVLYVILTTPLDSTDAAVASGPVSRYEMMEVDDSEFERLVSQFWQEKGYATRLTGGGADRGIDVIANREDETVVIEAKRYQDGHKVSAPTVQKAVGAREQFQADKAVIVTTSEFTEPAERAAADTGVELVDGQEFEDRYNSLLERAESLK